MLGILMPRGNFTRLVDFYNGFTQMYIDYVDGKEPNRALFHSVLDQYSTTGTLDTQALVRAIDWALKFELGRNLAQHQSLITKAQMDKLLAMTPPYNNLDVLVPAPIPLDRLRDKALVREN